MNSIDEFLKDIQPVNQQEDEDNYDKHFNRVNLLDIEQAYYFEELVTFMQALPKKAIF